MTKGARETIQRIQTGLTEHPERLIRTLIKTHPGMSEPEAAELANAFIGIFKPAQSKGEAEARARAYSAALDAANKKYPGEPLPELDIPALDLPELNIDLGPLGMDFD